MTDAGRSPLTFQEQAELIERLISRTIMREGDVAAETTMTLTKEDVADLDHLALRLRRMAPLEAKIRTLVMGK